MMACGSLTCESSCHVMGLLAWEQTSCDGAVGVGADVM